MQASRVLRAVLWIQQGAHIQTDATPLRSLQASPALLEPYVAG